MLYYDRINVFQRINVNKTSASEKSNICHYWYFLNYSFKFQPNVYATDAMIYKMMSITFSDIAILNIKGSDYRCIISLISKNEAIKLLQNADLTEKNGTLSNIKKLFLYIENG